MVVVWLHWTAEELSFFLACVIDGFFCDAYAFFAEPTTGSSFLQAETIGVGATETRKKIQTHKLIVPCRPNSIRLKKTIKIRYGLQNDQGFCCWPTDLHQIKPNNTVWYYGVIYLISANTRPNVAVAMFSVFLRTFVFGKALGLIVSKKQNGNTLLLGIDDRSAYWHWTRIRVWIDWKSYVNHCSFVLHCC